MPHYTTPEAAEYAFYSAIEGLNLEAMMAVWEVSDIIVCIHPMGPRLQGVQKIRESWRQIFNSNVQLRFRIAGAHRLYQDNSAFHIVYEHITVIGAEEQPAQPIIATNIYRRQQKSWHLVVHHASPGPVMGGNRRSSVDQIH
jgi:ketosteroid isomerase-like protein